MDQNFGEAHVLNGAIAREETVTLPALDDGAVRQLKFLRFGHAGARPKAYLQAGLHADELPGMLALRLLYEELWACAARGDILGEVVIAPMCNPIGIAQREGGYLLGRLERGTLRNFNRGFPQLAELVKRRVEGKLNEDGEENTRVIRAAMVQALAEREPADALETMQLALIRNACDADIVLDIHADNEALVHLYTAPAHWPGASDLAAEIDARAVLLSERSGGDPFDEACGAPWAQLARDFPYAAIEPACFSATLELRSNNAVDADLAASDARALLRFLQRRGVVRGELGPLPRLLCEATALTAMQQVKSPAEGLVVYRARLGDHLRVGDVIADIVPPFAPPHVVEATTDGVLFARHDQTWAWAGKVIGKVAGATPLPERVGHLLTD